MKAVFADTFYWIALTVPRDAGYNLVQAVAAPIRQALGLSSPLLREPTVRVVPQSHSSFIAGLDLYRVLPDKGFSLTDCISMQTMRLKGLSEVLTNDRHFEQEGFTVLLRV